MTVSGGGATTGAGGPLESRRMGSDVSDHLDVPLEDPALMEEVELVSNLMIAASESGDALTPEQIDILLGLLPRGHLPQQTDKRAPDNG